MNKTRAAAIAATAALAGTVLSVSYAQSEPAHTIPDKAIERGLEAGVTGADMGTLKRSEARMSRARIQRAHTFGDQRIVVAHASDAEGKPRIVYSLMEYEADLQKWYPAETWDRPDEGGFEWAEFDLSDGSQVLVWDRKPEDADVYIDGEAADISAAAGALRLEAEAIIGEVVAR